MLLLLLLFLDVICLKFLDHKSLLQLFINCENLCAFSDPSLSFKKYVIATLIG
jgi:hypothetical protein